MKLAELVLLRKALDQVFSPETAFDGVLDERVPSKGHCAVVALVVWQHFGGRLISAIVEGRSHWFNRVDGYDVDLTGDQFGFPAVQMVPEGQLYSEARIRFIDDVSNETAKRFLFLQENLKKLGAWCQGKNV